MHAKTCGDWTFSIPLIERYGQGFWRSRMGFVAMVRINHRRKPNQKGFFLLLSVSRLRVGMVRGGYAHP